MTKKTLFWIIVAFASAASFVFSWRYFSLAFPLLNIEITMSRDGARDAARERATRLMLARADTHTALRFSNDSDAQNFVELEGGGKAAFVNLLTQDIYQSFKWEVRFFREKDAKVATLYFTPQGKPYGFERHFPETEPGAALGADAARARAENLALQDWGIDLAPGKSVYAPAEQSLQKRPGGRVDHTFVYERSDQRLGKNGEGRVRLALVVAGDQLAAVRYFIKVPESFMRRYAEMRSANNAISAVDAIAIGLLYGLGGILVGLIVLARQHFVVSRPAIIAGAIVAAFQAAASLNRIPSAWFGYDTAISETTFLWQQVAFACVAFIGVWLMMSSSFMAAESLTRKAFGSHPQLWTVWSRGAAGSREILGRTLGGYLWVGFDLAFIVLFYFVTNNYLGWWSPADTLVDPNILATPMPWLVPVANSLQAGFWEECLFRAVPLAGAALLGDYMDKKYAGRFGGRRSWIIAGLVIEALIFGAGHAGYAQQPAYARPVELFIPALMWGIVYLRFGLLPGIIFHFVFDLLLMSLPIFATSAPGIELHRAAVVAFGMLPLGIVMWGRIREGRWQELSPALENAAWRPSPRAPLTPAALADVVHSRDRSVILRRILPWLGIAGFAAWAICTPSHEDSLPLTISRDAAEHAADDALRERGVELSADWKHFTVPESNLQQEDIFVWREGGANAYASLMGRYLAPPNWKVRYLRFDGDIAERAEEWHVYVESGVDGRNAGGTDMASHVRGIWHILPEARAGAVPLEAEARARVRAYLGERYPFEGLKEVVARDIKLPNRTDWEFDFSDTASYPLKSGEARVSVKLSGEEIIGFRRYVHVPEEWQRAERDRESVLRIAKIAVGIVVVLMALAAFIVAIIRATNGGMHKRAFFILSLATFGMASASMINAWESVAANLNSAEPYLTQVGLLVGGIGFGLLIAALAAGLIGSIGARGYVDGRFGTTRLSQSLLPGIALAGAFAGIGALATAYATPEMPHWASRDVLKSAIPGLAALISGGSAALIDFALVTFFLIFVKDFSADFTRRRWLVIATFMLVGLFAAAQAPTLSTWLTKGISMGILLTLVYVLIARFEQRLILIAMYAGGIVAAAGNALMQPYPGAWINALLYSAGVVAIGCVWFWWLERGLDARRGAAGASQA